MRRMKTCEMCGKEIKQLCEVNFEVNNILVGVYYLCPECGKNVMKYIDFKKATNKTEYGE